MNTANDKRALWMLAPPERSVWSRAVKFGFTAGLLQAAVNQGDHWLRHEVGDILPVNFPRPRERKAVMEHPDYYKLRQHLIEFLEVHAHRKHTGVPVIKKNLVQPLQRRSKRS